ncbi:MAG: inorganic phosphate transporter, partial [Chlamydiia bacterium]|nr:inorganic phosphate transporter [Chlamydiia bacterium]
AALLAAGAWLQLASYYGWPVSTTHSIVGAVIGFGLIHGGVDAIYWGKIGQIVASWLLSPLLGAVLSFIIFNFLRRHIFYNMHPTRQAKRLTPFIVFSVITTLCMVGLVKGLKNLQLNLGVYEGMALSMGIGAFCALISLLLVRRIPDVCPTTQTIQIRDPQVFYSFAKVRKHLARIESSTFGDIQDDVAHMLSETDRLERKAREVSDLQPATSEFHNVERIFAALQIISACFMAFAHGANDVANSIGPLAAAVAILVEGGLPGDASIPIWILALGGAGIVIGLATWGWRVVDTIGRRITELTPSRGFSAEFGASTTILLASKLGLPISTTHTLVGAVLGVGLARGIGAINLTLIRDIMMSWIITLPAGSIMAIFFFYVLKFLFG